ncbi:MAG: hypothetical protein NTW13_05030 [Candidatus Omnitrophica bacterium]|nr:hypothetical protein [Candidatus Omnitrophota bacterium]
MKKGEITKNLLQRLDWLLGFSAVIAVFCLIFLYSSKSIFDLDIWLHLKTGEFIFKNKLIPANDIFSFTLAGKPWVDHEWVFQLLSYFAFARFGADGLIYLEMFGIVAVFLILLFAGRRLTGAYLETAVLVFIAVTASQSRFNIRPDVFSMLFFCSYLYLLEFHANRKIIWLILPLQIIWVNLHGYFCLGLLVIAFYIAAELLRRKIKFLPRQWKEKGALDNSVYHRLKIILLVAILASFINPQGLRGAAYPVQVLVGIFSDKSKEVFGYIQELRPVFILKIASLKFYYLIGTLYLAALLLNIKRLRIRDILLGLFFLFFGIIARNILFFIAASFMVIAFYLGDILGKLKIGLLKQDNFKQIRYWLIRCVLAFLFLRFVSLEINSQLKVAYFDFATQEFVSPFFGLEKSRYPLAAVDFILNNNIPSRMFNDFNSGAYLIGKGYPLRQVFIDGRSELYSPEFFSQYQKAEKGDSASIEGIIKKYDLEAVLLTTALRKIQPIAGYFYKSPEWKLVFFDDKGILFLKNVAGTQELIKKYKINLNKYKVPPVDLKKLGLRQIYPDPYISRAFLFEVLGKDNLVIQEAKEALRILPNCWQAYYLLGRVYLRQGLYRQAWESLRQAGLFSQNNQEVLVELKKAKEGAQKKKE